MDETGRKKLWDSYAKHKSPEIREQLILEYAPLVKVVAGRLSMYFGSNVEYEDMTGYGIFGLIDAIDKFDYAKAVKFETYASLRIRGAILDQIRKMDWLPRTIRQHQKKIEMAVHEIECESGKAASEEEIAEKIGISTDDLLDWQSQMKITGLVSLNEYLDQGGEIPREHNEARNYANPETELEKGELKQKLAEVLETLTEKEKKVILLYYYEDLTLKEISNVMEVSESRVSQLHTRALQKMKGKMGKYMGLLTDR